MTMIKPPAFGSPCNNCGACCSTQLCAIAVVILSADEATTNRGCPMLEEADNGRMVCGFIRSPAEYAPVLSFIWGADFLRRAAKMILGVGWGCNDMTLLNRTGGQGWNVVTLAAMQAKFDRSFDGDPSATLYFDVFAEGMFAAGLENGEWHTW